MLYFSTRGRAESVPFKKALFDGLAPDGGLYMPAEIPNLGNGFFQTAELSYPELASRMILPFVGGDIPESKFNEICESAFNFDVPLVNLKERIEILELFRGPTLAFKDFAARFMARIMEYFLQGEEKELTVLVATSGDTGSAVANGFFGIKGIRVIILYPSGRVSRIQEQQLTTMGGNITALEVNGSFDDCQRLVKEVFQDKELRKTGAYSSANSINIARLLPQAVYYAWALHLSGTDEQPVVFSVPSGNFGNLTAGLIARRMGLPIEKFIAATNANDVFPAYLEAGKYKPQHSQQTISNAMDVGDPSNLERIQNLYGGDVSAIKDEISSWGFSDDETRTVIKESYDRHGYLADPHTAVGILGMNKYFKEYDSKAKGIVLSTAHPGKFSDVISPIIKDEQPIPEELKIPLQKEKHSIQMSGKYDDLKDYLLNM